MSARRTVRSAVAIGLVTIGLAGCGTDHGQAKALAACHLFASANGGGLSAPALTAKLGDAVHWAAGASKQSSQWDELHSSLSQYATASTEATIPPATRNALVDARKVIDNSCEIAARGY